MTTAEWWTLGVAVYGAFLSTFSTVHVIADLMGRRRKVAVLCRSVVTGVENFPSGPMIQKWGIAVQVVNKRPRSVTITDAGLRIKNRKKGFYYPHFLCRLSEPSPLPKKLDLGEMVAITFDRDLLDQLASSGNVPTEAVVVDAEGGKYPRRLPKDLTTELRELELKKRRSDLKE